LSEKGGIRYDDPGGCQALVSKLRARLIVAGVIVAVCVLSTQVVVHAHGFGPEAYHHDCPLCHLVHSGIPQPAALAQIWFAPHVAQFLLEQQPMGAFSAPIIHSIPRAPPV